MCNNGSVSVYHSVGKNIIKVSLFTIIHNNIFHFPIWISYQSKMSRFYQNKTYFCEYFLKHYKSRHTCVSFCIYNVSNTDKVPYGVSTRDYNCLINYTLNEL